MIEIVVDASVGVKWLVREADAVVAEVALADGVTLHAPEFFLIEVGNVLWKKQRSGDLSTEEARALLETLSDVGVVCHSDGALAGRALEIAIATSRTVYDCTYLALAERLKATLVTADERFVNGLAGTEWEGRAITLSAWAETRTNAAP